MKYFYDKIKAWTFYKLLFLVFTIISIIKVLNRSWKLIDVSLLIILISIFIFGTVLGIFIQKKNKFFKMTVFFIGALVSFTLSLLFAVSDIIMYLILYIGGFIIGLTCLSKAK